MITTLWRKLFDRCDHQWDIHTELEILRTRDNKLIGIHYHLRCKKCGDFKFAKAID